MILGGVVSSEVFALIIAIGVPLVLRVVDYFLPKGRYFKLVEKYASKDKIREDEEENEDGA